MFTEHLNAFASASGKFIFLLIIIFSFTDNKNYIKKVESMAMSYHFSLLYDIITIKHNPFSR